MKEIKIKSKYAYDDSEHNTIMYAAAYEYNKDYFVLDSSWYYDKIVNDEYIKMLVEIELPSACFCATMQDIIKDIYSQFRHKIDQDIFIKKIIEATNKMNKIV